MDERETLADWLNWTLENHPEVVKATLDGVGVTLHLWGGDIVFKPNLHGSGTYYLSDSSG